MNIQIRNEEATDLEQVGAVVKAAFPTDSESRLVDLLRTNDKAVVSLVAVADHEVLGHILFSPVTTAPPGDAKGIGLAPVAVRPDAQSRGIGSQLIREGLRRCRELGFDYCVVLGGPEYYHRFGFEKASQFGIQNEYGVDEEFMIASFSEQRPMGLIKYAPEFSELSV